MKSHTMIEFQGGGATCNQAPASALAESNVIKRHPEPKAKDTNKKQVDSSVALLLQNDVQGAGKFFGLCAQNDKAAQGDSSGFSPQNDVQGASGFFGLRPQNDVKIKK